MNVARGLLLMVVLAYPMLWVAAPRHRARIHAGARWLVLAVATLAMLTPFVWLVAATFKSRDAFARYLFLPPMATWKQTLSWENFRTLMAGDASVQGQVPFVRYLLNSMFVATATTTAQLFFSSLGGYALAKYKFYGREVLTALLLGSFLIPGMLLVAPLYKISVDVGLIDTHLGLLLPGAVSTYGMLLFRQAFASVPNDIMEAGRIDGCSEFGIYWRLMVPLVRPVSAAFCLVAFLGSWNAYLGPNVLLQSQDKLTLPIVLNLYVAQHYNQYGVFLAGTLLAIVPPALLFLLLQREFVRGLTSGSVKG